MQRDSRLVADEAVRSGRHPSPSVLLKGPSGRKSISQSLLSPDIVLS